MITIAKSKYETDVKPRLIEIEAWKRDGLTDEQIAKNLGIAYSTFREYKNKYSAFSAVLKKGKEVADIEVENALFKRAIGYEVSEKTVDIKIIDGKEVKQIKEVKKHIAGDVVAQIFWLKNRKRDKWKDKPDDVVDESISIKIKGI